MTPVAGVFLLAAATSAAQEASPGTAAQAVPAPIWEISIGIQAALGVEVSVNGLRLLGVVD
ncbi:MAG: hypothetical protein ACREAA_15370 [Candidatus Polarisedimenticolia bacterium]